MDAEIKKRRRHLPHWQRDGSVYFITFRCVRGQLPPIARRQLISNILYDHGRRYNLHMGVVMPDHTHLMLEPLRDESGKGYDLAVVMKSLKGVSARRINQILDTTGTVWQEESFDRIVRDEREYEEKIDYMWKNPVKAGLVTEPEEYEFFVFPPGEVTGG